MRRLSIIALTLTLNTQILSTILFWVKYTHINDTRIHTWTWTRAYECEFNGPIWIVFACCHLHRVRTHRKAFINVQLIFMRSTWIPLFLIVFDHHHRQRTMLCACCVCNCHLFITIRWLGVWLLHLLSAFRTRATKLLILICFYCRFKINETA